MRITRILGPGIMMAMTCIGASHIILAPAAGAEFGYALLWAVFFAHIFKYPAFEFAPRYSVATGQSLLQGYLRIPGPKSWAFHLLLILTIIAGISAITGILSVCAAIAYAGFQGISLPFWALIICTVTIILLIVGRYKMIENINKIMLTILMFGTLITFIAAPPDAVFLPHLIKPEIPPGSTLLVAALIGWMPGDLAISVMHSLWALEKRKEWRKDAKLKREGKEEIREEMMKSAMLDTRIGYMITLVTGLIFLMLGATVLMPRGLVPEGAEVAMTLSRIYTEILGSWIYPVFLMTAFFVMFSTAYNAMDGASRAFGSGIMLFTHNYSNEREKKLYLAFLVVIYVFSVLLIFLFQRPVMLVSLAAAVGLISSPFVYILNFYCVKKHVPSEMQPSKITTLLSILGIGFLFFCIFYFLILPLLSNI
ncbi:MAG: Nramp family divalent metal transporter [Halobacteriota archaeon]|nr:Nramp family divalent metal transporter [Halobacteriota archaeon]